MCPPPQNDVIAEAAECGGRLLVMYEGVGLAPAGGANGGGGAGRPRTVLDSFEPVAGPEAVQTPRQVSALL